MNEASSLSQQQLTDKDNVSNSDLFNQNSNNERKNAIEKDDKAFIQSETNYSPLSVPHLIINEMKNSKQPNSSIKKPPFQKEKRNRHDHLYENSKVLLAKRQYVVNERKRYEYNQMIPSITAKAQNIQRNPFLFSERLYPGLRNCNKKIMIEEEEDFIEEKDLYGEGNGNYKKIYHRNSSRNNHMRGVDSYSFKPTFDRNSLAIASKLSMNSTTRLTLPKYKTRSIKQFNGNDRTNHVSVNNKTLSQAKRSCHTPNQRSIQLYNRAMYSKRKKEEIIQQVKCLRDQEESSFPFKPQINTNSKSLLSRSNNKSSPNINQIAKSHKHDVYSRNYQWKENIEQETEKIKREKADQEILHCTFRPSINKQGIRANFTLRDYDSSQNLFVKRRKYCLLRQKEDEEIKKQKFFLYDYVSRNNRSYSRNHIRRSFVKDQTSMSRIEKSVFGVDRGNQIEVINREIHSQRSQLGLKDYFSNENNYERESKSYFDCDNAKSGRGRNNHSFALEKAIQKLLLSY